MNWYCDYADDRLTHDVYHQTEYGFQNGRVGPIEIRAEIFNGLKHLIWKSARPRSRLWGLTSIASPPTGSGQSAASFKSALLQQAEGQPSLAHARLSSICTDQWCLANSSTPYPRNRRAWVKLFKKRLVEGLR